VTAESTDVAGNRSPESNALSVIVDTTPPTGSIDIFEDNGLAQPSPDGIKDRTVDLSINCDDTGGAATSSGCQFVDITGDINATVTDEAQVDGTETHQDKELTKERASKTLSIVVSDFAGNDSVPDGDDSDTIELVPFVLVGTTNNTSPTWDVTTTTTSGNVTHSIQNTTDGIKVNFQDGTGDFLISEAICSVPSPDPACSWNCADDDRCDWSIDHIWASITDGGASNVVNARLVDNDNLPAANVTDFIEVNTPTGNGLVDDDGPDTINTQPQQISWTRDSIEDLGRNADSNSTTFTWGSAFKVGYTAESLAAPTNSTTNSTITINGQTVLYTGTILETEFDSPTNDTLSGDYNSGSVLTDLKVDGPDAIGTGHTLNVVIDSVDYTNNDLRSDLEDQIHETDKEFNPIPSVAPGQFFAVSGLVGDLDFYDDRYDDQVSGYSLADDFITFDGNGTNGTGLSPNQLTTTQLNGIKFVGVIDIADFNTTDPAAVPDLDFVPRTDRAIFLNENSKIILPPGIAGLSGAGALSGVDGIIIDLQNVLFNNQSVQADAIICANPPTCTNVTSLPGTFQGLHTPLTTPSQFARMEFNSIGEVILEIEIKSLTTDTLPDGIAVTQIILQNRNHNPPVIFDGTMDGFVKSTLPTEPGFTLPNFTVFPGIFYDRAESVGFESPDLAVRTFFQTIDDNGTPVVPGDDLPVGTTFFTGIDPVQTYSTQSTTLGFGVDVNINLDDDKGFVSYGCTSDQDEDGLCNPDEGSKNRVQYDAGTDTKDTVSDGDDTAVTFDLPIPKGIDYCTSSSTDFTNPTTLKKDVFVELDWGGGAHNPFGVLIKSGNFKFNGPDNLCDIMKVFDRSPALNKNGVERGIDLHFINNTGTGESNDVTAGGHIDKISVWTDRTTSLTDDFNSIKINNLGSPSLRPILGGALSIGDGGATTAEDSITISGLTIASPPGTSGEKTKGEIRVSVHLTLDDPTDNLTRTSDAKFDIAYVTAGADDRDFVILDDEITADVEDDDNETVTTTDDFEIIDVTIPFEIRNDHNPGTTTGYDIGTITIPFDTILTAAETGTEVAGFNTPVASSTKMEAYSQFVHYGIVVHSIEDCGPSGAAEINGNDFVISLGCKFGNNENDYTALSKFDTNGNRRSVGYNNEWTGTFMHELGHNFGLKHGGPEELKYIINDADAVTFNGSPMAFNGSEAVHPTNNPRHFKLPTPLGTPDAGINCKPNYVSVMSYSRQMPHTLKHNDYDLDFSSGHFADLLEASATLEAVGSKAFTDFDGGFSGSSGRTPKIVYGTPTKTNAASYADGDPAIAIDWDGDADTDDSQISSDINDLTGVNGCDGGGSFHRDWSDWWNLNLDFKGMLGATFDGLDLRDNIEYDARDNGGAQGAGESYDGLIFFNTLNLDGTNIGPNNDKDSHNSRMDLGGQLLTCDPDNDPEIDDVCIDTLLSVKKSLFYNDPLNAREVAPAECLVSDGGTPNDPTDDTNDFTLEGCNAVELLPINGADIRVSVQRCEDSSCLVLVEGAAGDLTNDGTSETHPLGPGFHQHADDGVYHFSVLISDLDPLSTSNDDTYAFNFNKVSGETGTLLNYNQDGDFLENAENEPVTVIITIPEQETQ